MSCAQACQWAQPKATQLKPAASQVLACTCACKVLLAAGRPFGGTSGAAGMLLQPVS
jgi:hypothetical protein